MSLSIKSDEAERLARSVAEATGESLTTAITVALRERLARIRNRDSDRQVQREERLRAIAADAGKRWTPEHRHVDHGELLYDDTGLPR
jgi:antitoxin VapB